MDLYTVLWCGAGFVFLSGFCGLVILAIFIAGKDG